MPKMYENIFVLHKKVYGKLYCSAILVSIKGDIKP